MAVREHAADKEGKRRKAPAEEKLSSDPSACSVGEVMVAAERSAYRSLPLRF